MKSIGILWPHPLSPSIFPIWMVHFNFHLIPDVLFWLKDFDCNHKETDAVKLTYIARHGILRRVNLNWAVNSRVSVDVENVRT